MNMFRRIGRTPERPARIALIAFCIGMSPAVWEVVSGARDIEPVTHQVRIEKFKFVPETLTIREGDSIEWVNIDLAPHTATAMDKSWDTGRLNKGQSMTVTFDEAATIEYLCLYHPVMRAKITVTSR